MSRRSLLLAALLVVTGCRAGASRQPVLMRAAIGSSTAPLMDDLMVAYGRVAPQVSFEITRGNADTLHMALDEGTVDWGLVSHLPAENGLWSAPVGSDALAMVVHPTNTLAGLTPAQVRDIYRGRVSNWAEVGGPDLPVVVVSREQGSAARGAFDELVMSGLPTTPAARLATSSSAVLSIVSQEPGAIGYLSLALTDGHVRPLAIDRVSPSQASVRSGDYPLSSVIYFTAADEPDGPAGDFLAWVLSDEGQAVVAQRYAPLAR